MSSWPNRAGRHRARAGLAVFLTRATTNAAGHGLARQAQPRAAREAARPHADRLRRRAWTTPSASRSREEIAAHFWRARRRWVHGAARHRRRCCANAEAARSIDLDDVTYYVGHETSCRATTARVAALGGGAVRPDAAQLRACQRLSSSCRATPSSRSAGRSRFSGYSLLPLAGELWPR